MTIDQEQARARATRELARRLRAVAPEGLLTDIDEFAASFVADMTAPNSRGRWCYVLAVPGLRMVERDPGAYERGAPIAREALARRFPGNGQEG